jgi:MOSC domain-containing protein YiiM
MRAMNKGQLQKIWIKRMKRGPMDSVESARIVAGLGLVGNANQGGRRQITLIEAEIWRHLMEQFSADLSPSNRRANLLIENFDLSGSRGRILRVGDCRIRIYGETKPCERMDEALLGLKDAMYGDWRGGAFGEALDDGEIRRGDVVTWIE